METLSLAYERCRRLHRSHGRTYYLATRLLPAWKRRHVHALYGFTRYADEIVDRTAPLPVQERARQLEAWSTAFLTGLGGLTDPGPGPGPGTGPEAGAEAGAEAGGGAAAADPLLPAVLHTIRVFDLDVDDFRSFLASMAMDLTITSYPTYADLLRYMEGSAAVIGTMMLPILEGGPAAKEPARQLGLAFQLTNFIRDVGEDLDRGRVYLPTEDLQRFGLTRADLVAAHRAGRAAPPVKALVRFEVARAREHYAAAAPGIEMLAPSSRPCIRLAFRLYGEILDEVERADHDVFVRRAVVGNGRRLRAAAGILLAPSVMAGAVRSR